MRSFAASERQETAALRDFHPVYVAFGSFTSFLPSRRVRFAPRAHIRPMPHGKFCAISKTQPVGNRVPSRKNEAPLSSTKQRIGDWLFRDHSSRRGARRLFRWRNYECDPGVPSVGPVLVGEFPVAFEIEVPLCRGGQGNNETELRAHANHARLEAANPIAGATVATDLLVDVANGTDKKLFR